MKGIIIALAISVALAACTGKQQHTDSTPESDTSLASTENSDQKNAAIVADTIVWAKVPDLKNIGTFPFFVPPGNLVMSDAKDGLSALIDPAELNNYTGSGIYSTKGKLGLMFFTDANDQPFNKLLFDDTFDGWVEQAGALLIYEGLFPTNEGDRSKLKESLYNGKKRTFALGDDEPFAVYAFKNNGKRYMINVQSNSAQGQVFIMELR